VHTQGQAQVTIGARPCENPSVAAARPLRRTFPGEPEQVATVRNFIRRYLSGRRCPAAVVQDILVCASELATNAVLHSRSGLPGAHFSVGIAICGGQGVCVVVEDAGGPWAGRGASDRDAECGRGLHVVSELSDDMGVTGDASGRMAWFRSRWSVGEAD
jgi:anti-sigma regulatory factor (Ser/Thr protein kinase)